MCGFTGRMVKMSPSFCVTRNGRSEIICGIYCNMRDQRKTITYLQDSAWLIHTHWCVYSLDFHTGVTASKLCPRPSLAPHNLFYDATNFLCPS